MLLAAVGVAKHQFFLVDGFTINNQSFISCFSFGCLAAVKQIIWSFQEFFNSHFIVLAIFFVSLLNQLGPTCQSAEIFANFVLFKIKQCSLRFSLFKKNCDEINSFHELDFVVGYIARCGIGCAEEYFLIGYILWGGIFCVGVYFVKEFILWGGMFCEGGTFCEKYILWGIYFVREYMLWGSIFCEEVYFLMEYTFMREYILWGVYFVRGVFCWGYILWGMYFVGGIFCERVYFVRDIFCGLYIL